MSLLLRLLLESCSLVARILSNKFVALALLAGVGVFLLIIPGLTNQLGANPIERLLHVSGEIAIWNLGAVLSLTPLRVLFPRSAIVNALNRHRRYISVSACIYGLIHFSCMRSTKAIGMICFRVSPSRLSGSV
jgi:DMSO/TMAO reductase YedYZ heme-binding membrane subunit